MGALNMKQKKGNKTDKSKKSLYGPVVFKYECSLEQRRDRLPTPVFWPGEFPWGREELDRTE